MRGNAIGVFLYELLLTVDNVGTMFKKYFQQTLGFCNNSLYYCRQQVSDKGWVFENVLSTDSSMKGC